MHKGENSMSNSNLIFSSLRDRWPSTFISRDRVSEFTGGAINPRTLANLDSLGKGPAGRFRLGKKVCYPMESFITWLESRCKEL
jgi:hypothetical protein